MARRVTDWYVAHVPDDEVPYWDFADPGHPRGAARLVVGRHRRVGMVDLSLVEPSQALRDAYLDGARALPSTLVSPAYLSQGSNPAVLLHGTYSQRMGIADRGLAFGDAFFLEALLRLRRADPGVGALAIKRVRADKGSPRPRSTVTSPRAGSRAAARRWTLRLSEVRDVSAVRVALAGGDRRAAALVVSGLGGRRALALASFAR